MPILHFLRIWDSRSQKHLSLDQAILRVWKIGQSDKVSKVPRRTWWPGNRKLRFCKLHRLPLRTEMPIWIWNKVPNHQVIFCKFELEFWLSSWQQFNYYIAWLVAVGTTPILNLKHTLQKSDSKGWLYE